MSFCNLGAFKLFFLPAERRVAARSVSVTRHFKVPQGAILVGTYAWPFPAAVVLEDLDEVLARPPPVKARPKVEHDGIVAQPRPIPETRWTWLPPRFAK